MSVVEIDVEELASEGLLVRRKNPTLNPTLHLPSEDDPTRPRCNKNDPSGNGYRDVEDAEDVRLDQLCGSCLDKDKLRGEDRADDFRGSAILSRPDVTTIEEARQASQEADP